MAPQYARVRVPSEVGLPVKLPKLVVFDVDGTLVDFDGATTADTRAVLDRLRVLGIPIALATGRPMAIAHHTLDQVGGATWMACGNGSVLFETESGRLLRDRCLPDDVVEPLIVGLRAAIAGVGFAVELSHTVIEEHGFARRVPEPPQSEPVDDALAVLAADPGRVRRVIPFHDDYDHRLRELAAVVEGFIDDRCQVQFGGLPIVDVSPNGDHKALALQVLVDHLGIDVSEVVAFGDGLNDLEMLEWAGTGVAMGNARPEVRDRADAVTAAIGAGGVAAFLNPLLD